MAKIKLPRKIAGFRVPKSIRKSRMLRAMLNSPMGRDVLANAITAGAGAAAAVLVAERKEVARTTKKSLRKGGGLVGEVIHSATNAAFGVVAEAAQTLMPERSAPKGKEGKALKH